MERITSIRGFRDILPGESEKWQFVEEKAREIFGAYGVREIRIPILEKTDLFRRGSVKPPTWSRRKCTRSWIGVTNP